LHAQIKFYGISKFIEQTKSSDLKKNIARARSARNGPKQRGSAQIHPWRTGDADSNGWQVGLAGQRLWEAESVHADLGRPIK
jgi:hypothetical protein